jgi:hypothetical protein
MDDGYEQFCKVNVISDKILHDNYIITKGSLNKPLPFSPVPFPFEKGPSLASLFPVMLML